MVKNKARSTALKTMRDLVADGWQSEALIVDAAAEAIGGDDQAKMTARRVWDEFFKIHVAN